MDIPEIQRKSFPSPSLSAEQTDWVDEASQESFPASDPPAWLSGKEAKDPVPGQSLPPFDTKPNVPGAALRIRKLIPPLTLRVSPERIVRAWDFKQKRNLIIAFLDANCMPCEKFACDLAAHAANLAQREAIALLVFPEIPGSSFSLSLAPGVIAGTDVGGESAQDFLGRDAVSLRGLVRLGVFVTDRYGELSEQWVFESHGFPPMQQILSALDQIEMACEECGDPPWIADGE